MFGSQRSYLRSEFSSVADSRIKNGMLTTVIQPINTSRAAGGDQGS
jgi:hypothetical protein